MSDVQKTYYISCSGTGFVTMREDRLEELLEMTPTLRFLFFGHPQMMPKTIKQFQDGTPVLEIPVELQVHKSSFVLFVNCALEFTPLPAYNKQGDSRLTELLETLTVLGGCTKLEQRLRDHSATNPSTPEEDMDENFFWSAVETSRFVTLSTYEASGMYERGFSLASMVETASGNKVTYFRKNKHN